MKETTKVDLNIGRRIILKYILEKSEWGDMDWIDLVSDRDQWSASVKMVVNLVRTNVRNFFSS
jgi:hypothetical protein